MTLRRILPLSFFRWCEEGSLGGLIQHSRWSFAIIETIHIMALAVLLGALLIIDLHILGWAMRQQHAGEVVKQFGPWSWISLGFMVLTGIPMYLSEAVRLGNSPPFFYKMLFLFVAVGLHLRTFKTATKPLSDHSSAADKLTASLSLVCWVSVALAGRAIAFLSK